MVLHALGASGALIDSTGGSAALWIERDPEWYQGHYLGEGKQLEHSIRRTKKTSQASGSSQD